MYLTFFFLLVFGVLFLQHQKQAFAGEYVHVNDKCDGFSSVCCYDNSPTVGCGEGEKLVCEAEPQLNFTVCKRVEKQICVSGRELPECRIGLSCEKGFSAPRPSEETTTRCLNKAQKAEGDPCSIIAEAGKSSECRSIFECAGIGLQSEGVCADPQKAGIGKPCSQNPQSVDTACKTGLTCATICVNPKQPLPGTMGALCETAATSSLACGENLVCANLPGNPYKICIGSLNGAQCKSYFKTHPAVPQSYDQKVGITGMDSLCAEGLDCDEANDICKMSAGQKCGQPSDCVKGLSCMKQGEVGADMCVTDAKKALGSACASSSECKEGLFCENVGGTNKCVDLEEPAQGTLGAICDTNPCGSGLACAEEGKRQDEDKSEIKICKGKAGAIGCSSRLQNSNYTAYFKDGVKIPPGSATAIPAQTSQNKLCGTFVNGTEVALLACSQDRCSIPEDMSCEESNACVAGTSCVAQGVSGDKLCVSQSGVRGYGGQCADILECETGLVCRSSVCAKNNEPIPGTIGAVCGQGFSSCGAGLACVLNHGIFKQNICVGQLQTTACATVFFMQAYLSYFSQTIKVQDAQPSANDLCEQGLVCSPDACRATAGSSCKVNEDCSGGLSCVFIDTEHKICANPSAQGWLGQSCQSPCQPGISCNSDKDICFGSLAEPLPGEIGALCQGAGQFPKCSGGFVCEISDLANAYGAEGFCKAPYRATGCNLFSSPAYQAYAKYLSNAGIKSADDLCVDADDLACAEDGVCLKADGAVCSDSSDTSHECAGNLKCTQITGPQDLRCLDPSKAGHGMECVRQSDCQSVFECSVHGYENARVCALPDKGGLGKLCALDDDCQIGLMCISGEDGAKHCSNTSEPYPGTLGAPCGSEFPLCGEQLICKNPSLNAPPICLALLGKSGCKDVFAHAQLGEFFKKAGVLSMHYLCDVELVCKTDERFNGACLSDYGFLKTRKINTGADTQDIQNEIRRALNIFLSFLAIAGILIIVYGGILWATAAGNDEQVEKARKILISAVIGLIIVGVAWTLVSFVFHVQGSIA